MNEYIQTEWKTGDVITSENLNKLEEGTATGRVIFFDLQVDEEQLSDSETRGGSSQEPTIVINFTPRMILNILQQGNLPVFRIIDHQGKTIFIRNIAFINQVDGMYTLEMYELDKQLQAEDIDSYFIINNISPM